MKTLELKIPPLILVVVFAFLMWLISQSTLAQIWSFTVPITVPIGLVAIGILITVLGVLAFKRAQTTVNPLSPESSSSLVKTNVYMVTRNPMYVGFLCLLLALWLYLGIVINIVCVIGFIIYMNQFQIKPEEQMLTKIFGDEYLNYQQKVRRWL